MPYSLDMPITHCFLCSFEVLSPILDLGEHPLADTFLKEEQLAKPEERYPLRLVLCEACGHVMSGWVVPATKRYQDNDYSYSAGNSPVSVRHFEELADWIIAHTSLSKNDLVVDIGSSDGTLLSAIQEKSGARVFGVEPSQIAQIANARGINTMQDFFGESAVAAIEKAGKAKVIVATNVFNHIEDVGRFLRSIKAALSPGGVFVFEVPYLLRLIEKTAFDTVYLEHVSYFSVKPLSRFFKEQGLSIIDIADNDYMGGSLRMSVSVGGTESPLVAHYVQKEESARLFERAMYAGFAERVVRFKEALLFELRAAKSAGGTIIGIGAATKGNTLLNYCGIDTRLLDFVTDSSPLKIGKYMPGSRLPIKSDEAITPDVTHALILPWNIADFLKGKLAPKYPNISFITPHMEQ